MTVLATSAGAQSALALTLALMLALALNLALTLALTLAPTLPRTDLRPDPHALPLYLILAPLPSRCLNVDCPSLDCTLRDCPSSPDRYPADPRRQHQAALCLCFFSSVNSFQDCCLFSCALSICVHHLFLRCLSTGSACFRAQQIFVLCRFLCSAVFCAQQFFVLTLRVVSFLEGACLRFSSGLFMFRFTLLPLQ